MKTRLKVKCSVLKRKRPTKEAVSTKTGTRCSPKSSTGLNKPLNTRVLSLSCQCIVLYNYSLKRHTNNGQVSSGDTHMARGKWFCIIILHQFFGCSRASSELGETTSLVIDVHNQVLLHFNQMSLRALRKQLGPRAWPCALALFELGPFHPK